MATVSSMRPGWMRPSLISLLSAIRATSRRTGSKPDSTTASGVSSMIRSTPVACSSARMLRPSRPMMRPFISSFGRATTVIVASEVWSAAMRCMTVVSTRRARSSPSSARGARSRARGAAPRPAPRRRSGRSGPARASRGGEARHALELHELALLELAPRAPARPRARAGAPRSPASRSLERGHLAIERLLPVQESALGTLRVGALLARLLLGGATHAEGLVLPLEDDLLLLGARFGDEALGVVLGVLDRVARPGAGAPRSRSRCRRSRGDRRHDDDDEFRHLAPPITLEPAIGRCRARRLAERVGNTFDGHIGPGAVRAMRWSRSAHRPQARCAAQVRRCGP